MKCTNCNEEIDDESNYCMWCGKIVESQEKSEYEIFYNVAMKIHVMPKLKSPSTAQWAKFEETKIKMVGILNKFPVIETYIDAMNSYGAINRVGVRIKYSEDLQYLGVTFKDSTQGYFGTYHY